MYLRVINNISLLRKDKKLEVSPIIPPTFLEIGLKSSVISKVDHPLSKNWKKGSKPLLETTNKFWGPIVHEDQLCWGPFVHGVQMSWDCLYLGTNCGGPNVWGLNVFGTKCVWDQMRSSLNLVSIRTFRRPLFSKPVSCPGLFLPFSYSKIALAPSFQAFTTGSS